MFELVGFTQAPVLPVEYKQLLLSQLQFRKHYVMFAIKGCPRLRKRDLDTEIMLSEMTRGLIYSSSFDNEGSAWGDWSLYTASPLRAFESELGVQDPVGFFDPLGYVTAHIMVEEKYATECLNLSGQHAIFVRQWPLPPAKLEWLPQLPGEHPRQHLERALACNRQNNGNGLVWHQKGSDTRLGVRLPLQPGETQNRSFLLRPPLSPDISDDAVVDILNSAGWKQTTITRRIFLNGRAHKNLLVVKAEPPAEAVNMLDSDTPDSRCKIYNHVHNEFPGEFQIELYRGRPRPTQQNVKSLKVGAWAVTSSDATCNPSFLDEMDTVQEEDEEAAQNDKKRKPDDAQTPATAEEPTQPSARRARVTGKKATPDQRKQQEQQQHRWLRTHGLSLKNVPGDGNCWYHAVGYHATNRPIRPGRRHVIGLLGTHGQRNTPHYKMLLTTTGRSTLKNNANQAPWRRLLPS